MTGQLGDRSLFRRRFLSGVAATVGFGSYLASSTASATGTARSVHASVTGSFAPEIPDAPQDPHLVTAHGVPPLLEHRGWESADRDAVVESILDLDPDLFGSQALTGFAGPPLETHVAHRHQEVALFASEHGLPHSLGFHPNLEVNTVADAWYDDLPEERKWTRPDGTTVSHPRELAGRDFDGGPHAVAPDGSVVVPSVFAPGTFDLMARTGAQIYQLGVTHMWIDGLGFARLKGNDFSEWAQTAFREHLETLPDDRLAELGVSNPSRFDVTSYLREEGVDPFSGVETPAIDPVYREFTRFQHRHNKEFLLELADRCQAGAPDAVAEAGTRFYGNLGGLSTPMPVDIYASDAADVIAVEADPTVPPVRPNDVTVKTARAAGRFEKPVRVVGKLHKIREMDTLTGLDPTEQYPTLMQFQVAQGYAHGGVRNLSLTSWADVPNDSVVNNWVRSDGSIPDVLQEFTDFVRSHERFLDDAQEANRAVLAVSLPTLVWQRAPQWEQYVPAHSRAVRAAAAALRREHVPYDVVILDDPSLWEAPEQYGRLGEYDLVVLPGVEAMSDQQVDAVEEAVGVGTAVVATGGGPSRNLEYEPRDDVRTVLQEADAATIIDENLTGNGDDSRTRALREALSDRGQQVALGTDGDVSVNVTRRADGDGVVVHLLNFEYDPETDSMPTRSNLDVTVRGLPFAPEAATFYSPSGAADLEIESDGTAASVTVPRLEVWGFVVFDAGTGAGQDADESTAESRVADARSAVKEARDDGRTVGLRKADATLSNAERSLEFDAYSKSASLATAAIAEAEDSYRTPVVGIDAAHDQSTATYDAGLGRLRETFDAYGYRDVSSWTEDALAEIDVLVVPPLDAESSASFEVASSELDALEAFVRAGGSLLLLGSGGAKPGLNRVAERFGFEFDLRPVLREEEGDLWAHRVESPLSDVTQYVPRWTGRFGTVLREVGDATVLGRVAPGQSVWLHDQEPLVRRTAEEPDTAGRPVMAGTRVGDGHVVVSGESQQFVDPRTFDGNHASPLPENVLRTLGRRARVQLRTETSTSTTSTGENATPRSTTTGQSASEQTTTGGTPGFTAPAAVLAGSLAALRYLWAELGGRSE